MSQAEILVESSDDQDKVDRCVQAVIAAIEADVNFRLPEEETDREAALAVWLASYRQQLEPLMIEEVERAKQIVNSIIWPKITHQLHAYYVRYRAAIWVRQHMGDATILGNPVFHEPLWYIPLGTRPYGMGFGRLYSMLQARCYLIERQHARRYWPKSMVKNLPPLR